MLLSLNGRIFKTLETEIKRQNQNQLVSLERQKIKIKWFL